MADSPIPEVPKPKPKAPTLESLVQTIQFAWFVGHVLAFAGAVFYLLFSLRIFKSPSFPLFWYRESYVAVIFTFGIILYQTYKGRPVTPQALAKDDNLHYVLVALLWLFSKPFFGTLPPFMVFSLFHILSYTRSYLLPALGHPSTSPISTRIQSFVKNYNDRFMMLAANMEFVLVFMLFARFVTFRKGTTVPFIFYLFFIKARYDQSFYMRTVVKGWEVRIDSLAGHPSVPAGVKQAWIQAKGGIRRGSGLLSAQAPRPAKTE